MPLFYPTKNRGIGPVEPTGERSNTGLIVGNHDTPNKQLMLDQSLPVLFDYEYGGPGQKKVVISKGMAVALTGELTREYETGRWLPKLTIADFDKPDHRFIGLAPFNLCKRIDNILTGNKANVINDKYVELPYIPDLSDAELIKWGAIVGDDIRPGDWVRPAGGDNAGKLTKWSPYKRIVDENFTDVAFAGGVATIKTSYPIRKNAVEPPTSSLADDFVFEYVDFLTFKISKLDGDGALDTSYTGTHTFTVSYTSLISDPIESRIAQVLEAELDQEPWGWLKWAMWDEDAKMEDLQDKYKSAPDVDEGFPFDERYRDGLANRPGYLNMFTTNPTGVPGLLDGRNKAQKVWSKAVTLAGGSTEGEKLTFTMQYKDIIPSSVEIKKVDGTVIYTAEDNPENIRSENGKVIITVGASLAGELVGTDIQAVISYRSNFYGTPTGWDHKGAVGAMRLLLQL